MTRLAVIACAAAALAAPTFMAPAAAATARIEGAVPRSYDVDLTWAPSTRTLTGSTAIAVENAGPGRLSRVWLRLWPNSISPKRGTGCGGARDRVTAVEGAAIGDYRQTCSAVALDLPAPLAPGGRASFRLSFAFEVPSNSDWRNQGVDLFGNAMPVVAVSDERGLHLDPYPPDGEADYHLVADWRVSVGVPDALDVAMTGLESSTAQSGGRTFTATARARDFALAVGQLSSRSAAVDGVRLRVVSSRRSADKLDGALRRLERSFSAYQRWYGGYTLADLDVVVGNYDFGGTEYPGIVLSNPDLATVSHEVAHQWFYAIVGNDQYDDPWLDESFATWNEQQFDRYYKCDPADPLDGSAHGLATGMDYWDTREDAYDDVIYRGGYCALTRLERDVGHERFVAVLRNYVADFHDGVARTDDFLREVRRVAPSYDVDAWARLVGLT